MSQAQAVAAPKASFKTYAVLMTGIMAVSLAAIFIRLAQDEGVPSMFIAAARLVLASILLTPFVLRRYRNHIRQMAASDLLLTILSGFILAIHFATWVSSLEYTTVLVSVALVTTSPLWTALLETVFLRVHLSRMLIVALGIAFTGGIILSIPDNGQIALGNDPVRGAILATTGAAAFSIYTTIGRKVRAKLPVLPYIWMVYSCAAIVLSIVVLLSRIPVTGYSAEGYLWLVALALIPQLIGHSSFNYALGYLPATVVNMFIQLEPIISGLIALIVFQEAPTWVKVLGTAITLVGVALASIDQKSS